MKKTALEIKVMAVNLLREYAKQFIAYELEHFNQFIGVDIFKVDGSIKAKYDHEKLTVEKRLPDGTWLTIHYWFKKYNTSLDMQIKLCINGGKHEDNTAFTHYENLSATMYNLDDNTLQPADVDRSYLDIRYNEKDLTEQAAKIKAAAEKYRAELDKMPYDFREIFYIERLVRN